MLGRIFKFVAGVIVGLLALPMAAGLALTILVLVVIALGEPAAPAQGAGSHAAFWTEGGDISRSGGTVVMVREIDGSLTRQTCRETCDDLIMWVGAAERVEVRGADGECLLCKGQGLRLPFTSPKRWALAGRPLKLHEKPWE